MNSIPPFQEGQVLDCSGPLPARAVEGLRLFNEGKYWLAHEALEAAWRAEDGPVRDLYRGVLQAGVVYLHIERGNLEGALKVYRRCRRWLALFPEECRGIQVGKLRNDLELAVKEARRLGAEHIGEFDRALFKPVEVR
jgi:predicted metal-dependent hydrolase